jgi:hypothetical protein
MPVARIEPRLRVARKPAGMGAPAFQACRDQLPRSEARPQAATAEGRHARFRQTPESRVWSGSVHPMIATLPVSGFFSVVASSFSSTS